MFGFLKKLGKKSEPVAPIIPVEASPAPFEPVAVAEPEYIAPAAMPRPSAPRPVAARAVPTAPPPARPVPAVQPQSMAPRPVPPIPAVPRAAAPVRTAAPLPSAPPPARVPLRATPLAETPVYNFSHAAPGQAPAVETHIDPAAVVELPLKKLWHKLNPAVVQSATEHPNGESMLRVPLALLHAQLARGLVRFSFAEFRQLAPAGLFTPSTEKDGLEVDISIGDVLPLLQPEHLSRRPQRRVEVPDDIGPIFGPDGGPAHGLRVAEAKGRAPVKPAATTPPAAASVNNLPPAPVAATPIAQPESNPASRLIPAPSITPVAPVTPISPIAQDPVTPISPFSPIAPSPVAATSLADEPIRAPKLDPSLASLKPKVAPVPPSNGAPISAAVPAARAASASSSGAGNDTFTIALMDVAAFWSEKGRNELSNLYRHSLEIPVSTLERSLKTGKLVFQWREVRPWLRLAVGNSMPTLQDDLQIELPVAIIAPRYLEQRSGARPKRRVEVGDDIPDVFEQKTPPPGLALAASAPVLGATAVPMDLSGTLNPSSKTGDTAFLVATGGKTLLEFGEIFGQPEKKSWTMAEVAQKTITLRGVEGAIIGSVDGLLVAGTWPNGVKGDAVAAFLPQLYGRISQFTKEIKLGDPAHLTLVVENLPLQIFRAGTSFLAVVGRAGENLPKAQLNAIATRLATNFSVK